jgi:outer membrane receptor protein involved in Fe transport
VLDGLRVYNTAQYIGMAALEIAPARAWWRFRVAGNWVGPYSPFDEPGQIIGAYGLAHVSGSALWGNLRLDVGIRNVFDRAYPELVAGHVIDPGQPRAVFTTLRVAF